MGDPAHDGCGKPASSPRVGRVFGHDDLVAQNARHLPDGDLAVEEVQIGAAEAPARRGGYDSVSRARNGATYLTTARTTAVTPM